MTLFDVVLINNCGFYATLNKILLLLLRFSQRRRGDTEGPHPENALAAHDGEG